MKKEINVTELLKQYEELGKDYELRAHDILALNELSGGDSFEFTRLCYKVGFMLGMNKAKA